MPILFVSAGIGITLGFEGSSSGISDSEASIYLASLGTFSPSLLSVFVPPSRSDELSISIKEEDITLDTSGIDDLSNTFFFEA